MKNALSAIRQEAICLTLSLTCFVLLGSLTICGTAQAAVTEDDDTISISATDLMSQEDLVESNGLGGTLNITTVTSSQTMDASSTGNSVYVFGNMTNGAITVGENFGGSGFGSYVMNTGNNATINSGVSVSVLTLQQ